MSLLTTDKCQPPPNLPPQPAEPPRRRSGRKTVRRGAAIAICVLAAAAGWGCRGSEGHIASSAEAPRGVVAGTLQMVGGPAPGIRRLGQTRIDIVDGTRVVAATTTDDRGRFRLSLAPGRYRLRLADGAEVLPRYVRITPAETVHILLKLEVK